MWGLVNLDFNASNFFVIGLISALAGLMSAITGPIVKSTLQNVTMPQMRGQAFALLNTFDDFGRGLGPAFVAWLIERLGGRRTAFNVGISGWVLCGLLNGCLFFTVEADEEKVRMGVEQMLEARSNRRSTDSDRDSMELT